MKIGTTCGSNDTNLIEFLQKEKEAGEIDYVELYLLPDVKFKEILAWENSGLPIKVIHAAHGPAAEVVPENIEMTLSFASRFLHPDWIIFDAGIDRTFNLWQWQERGVIPETMPTVTLLGSLSSLSMPDEVNGLFCLDFSHAWITANILHVNPRDLIKEFLLKGPSHFHVTDCRGTKEDHLPIGFGEVDFSFVLSTIPSDSTVTIETEHAMLNREDRMLADIRKFREYVNGSNNPS